MNDILYLPSHLMLVYFSFLDLFIFFHQFMVAQNDQIFKLCSQVIMFIQTTGVFVEFEEL